jgi:hypothetical protein
MDRMSHIICDNQTIDIFDNDGLFTELYDWLRANGLMEIGLCMGEPVTVADSPDGRVICYTVRVGDPAGDVTAPRTSPLLVEPPASWPRG